MVISIDQKNINKELSTVLTELTFSQLDTIQNNAIRMTKGLGVKLLLEHMYSEFKLC